MYSVLFDLDISLLHMINSLYTSQILDLFFLLVSAAGYLGIFWIVCGVSWVMWVERRDHKTLVSVVAAVFIAVSLSYTVKISIKRHRPIYISSLIREVGAHTDTYSFPSGHTAVAIAAAYVLRRGKKPFPRWIWLAAALVAYSRMYLGKHFPSDIAAGAILGWGIGWWVTCASPLSHKKHV